MSRAEIAIWAIIAIAVVAVGIIVYHGVGVPNIEYDTESGPTPEEDFHMRAILSEVSNIRQYEACEPGLKAKGK